MALIELHFPVLESTLPTDHAYGLYAALSRLAPWLHESSHVQIGSLAGHYVGNGLLQVEPRRSRLRLRLPAEEIPAVLPLAGKALSIDVHSIRLGVPFVRGLVPAASLIARLVTIKTKERTTDAAAFLEAARRKLAELGIQGEATIPLVRNGRHAGEPRRHVLRIKDKRIVGYSLQVTGLTAEESIKLQEHGLGGRAKMGCGFFVPIKEREQSE